MKERDGYTQQRKQIEQWTGNLLLPASRRNFGNKAGKTKLVRIFDLSMKGRMGVCEMSVPVSPQNDCVFLTKTEFLKLFKEMAFA